MRLTGKRGWMRVLTCVAALLMLFGAIPASAQAPTANSEMTNAIVKSGTAYLRVTYTGYLVYPDTTAPGQYLRSAYPTRYTAACSGWVADSSGVIVSAGHCVDHTDPALVGDIVFQYFQDLVDQGQMTVADGQSWYDYYEQYPSEFAASGTPTGQAVAPPDVAVILPAAANGTSLPQGLPASIQSYKPFSAGDIAILKVQVPNGAPIPELEVRNAPVRNGETVLASGFPGKTEELIDSSAEPAIYEGKISRENVTRAGSPFFQSTAATSSGMSGGPVTDADGRVVGLTSFVPADEPGSDNFATGLDTIQTALRGSGANLELSPADQAYREGLGAYYAQDFLLAEEKFDQTLETYPAHAQAQNFKRLAAPGAEVQQADNNRWWVIVGIIAVCIVVALLVLVFVLRKRRAKQASAGNATSDPSGNRCGQCNMTNPPGNKFCSHCGQPLGYSDATGGDTKVL